MAARPGGGDGRGGERGRHGAVGDLRGSALPPLRPSRRRPRSPRPARPVFLAGPRRGGAGGEGRAVLSEAEEAALGRLDRYVHIYIYFFFSSVFIIRPPRPEAVPQGSALLNAGT